MQLLPQEFRTVCRQTYETPTYHILPVQVVAKDIFIWTVRTQRIVNSINSAVIITYLLTYLLLTETAKCRTKLTNLLSYTKFIVLHKDHGPQVRIKISQNGNVAQPGNLLKLLVAKLVGPGVFCATEYSWWLSFKKNPAMLTASVTG